MRRLTLRKETLTTLGDAALSGIAGGTHLGCGVTDACTHRCRSLDVACPTVDVACPTNPITGCVQTVDTCVAIEATLLCTQ